MIVCNSTGPLSFQNQKKLEEYGNYRIENGDLLHQNLFDSASFIQRVDSMELQYKDSKENNSSNLVRRKMIGRYILGKKIGKGSYGKVREGIDSESLQRVAIKIMSEKRLKRIPNGENNVNTEIRLLKKLSSYHPNIISMLHEFRSVKKGKRYIVFDYCLLNLQQYLDETEQNKLSLDYAQKYFKDLINGLEHLHSKGILHRDIKPSNLLIGIDGRLKISDFGVAEEMDLYTASDHCFNSNGSPAFHCPEIASAKEKFSGIKADIWAAGVTLYNMVTGAYPFDGETVYELYDNIVNHQFCPIENIDPLLLNLLKGMLAKNEKDRYTIEQIRNHAWMRHEYTELLTLEALHQQRYQTESSVICGLTTFYYGLDDTNNSHEAVSGGNSQELSTNSTKFIFPVKQGSFNMQETFGNQEIASTTITTIEDIDGKLNWNDKAFEFSNSMVNLEETRYNLPFWAHNYQKKAFDT